MFSLLKVLIDVFTLLLQNEKKIQRYTYSLLGKGFFSPCSGDYFGFFGSSAECKRLESDHLGQAGVPAKFPSDP
jgi:hypothetical protein